MTGQTLRVAIAEAPDGGDRIGPADERVVGGDAAILKQTVDLAIGTGQILGIGPHAALPDTEEDVS